MEKTLNIAIGSTCSKPGDIQGNLAQIGALAKMAGGCGCRLLLTPELSASGYGGYPEVLAAAEAPGQGPIYEGLAALARQHGLVVTAGFSEKGEGKTYLSHYGVYPDGHFVVQRKHRVTPLEYPLSPSVDLYFDDTEEIGHVTPGMEQLTVFGVDGVNCAIIICADLGLKDLHGVLDRLKVELLLLPVGAGGKREDKATDAILRTPEGQAQYKTFYNETLRYGDGMVDCLNRKRAIVAVNQCGFDGKALYHGGSGSIVSPFGELVAVIPGIQNIDRPRLRFAWGEVSFYEDREAAYA